jgi:hypothetical protein
MPITLLEELDALRDVLDGAENPEGRERALPLGSRAGGDMRCAAADLGAGVGLRAQTMISCTPITIEGAR